MIRLGVLFLILIGVGIFGWNRRPDLVRNYLGVNAPARDTGQALQFANATLFGLATELTEAEVTFLDQGQDRLAAMIENGGGDRTITAAAIRKDPAAFSARCVEQLQQIKLDTKRAMETLDVKTFRSGGDQASLWKTLDLARQVQRTITVLSKSDMGKTLDQLDAGKAIGEVVDQLKKIQQDTSPHQRTTAPKDAPVKPNAFPRDEQDASEAKDDRKSQPKDDQKDEPSRPR